MEGKRIIVIGGGTYRMRNMWPDAEGYGIKVQVKKSCRFRCSWKPDLGDVLKYARLC
jgi:hypothetical protein